MRKFLAMLVSRTKLWLYDGFSRILSSLGEILVMSPCLERVLGVPVFIIMCYHLCLKVNANQMQTHGVFISLTNVDRFS